MDVVVRLSAVRNVGCLGRRNAVRKVPIIIVALAFHGCASLSNDDADGEDTPPDPYGVISTVLNAEAGPGLDRSFLLASRTAPLSEYEDSLAVDGFVEDESFARALADLRSRNSEPVSLDESRIKTDAQAIDFVDSDSYVFEEGDYLLQLSQPGIADDRSIIYVSTFCGGLCGDGVLYLLKGNEDGTWTISEVIGVWVS